MIEQTRDQDYTGNVAPSTETPLTPRKVFERAYYQKNRERILKRGRDQYFERNKENILRRRELALTSDYRAKEYRRLWHQRNKDRRAERAKELLSQDPIRKVKRVQASTRWRNRNKSKCAAYCRQYKINNRSRINRLASEWRARNKEKLLAKNQPRRQARHADWRRKNKGKSSAYAHKYRALREAASINLKSIVDWMHRVKSKPTARCYHCDEIVKTSEIHFDHIVALSKGGIHAVENLCVSCASCNLSKGAKPIRAWIKIGQQNLEL